MCKTADDTLLQKKAAATESSSVKSSTSINDKNLYDANDKSKVYSWIEPAKTEPPLQWRDHFSSLLFGGSIANTVLEHALLLIPTVALYVVNEDQINVQGSMPFKELVTFFWITAFVRRFYNAYLEAVYFNCPQYRIQPPKEHKLQKEKKDLCGRDLQQLELLEYHDKFTMISQFLLNVGMYYALPGFYPAAQDSGDETTQSFQERFVRLLLNHYVMSFGMYWAHRSLHVIPYLWDNIHSIHHWAKHPLSRNTYEDHWADNFGNAIVGHLFAQILVPLDNPTFWFSRVFRILESLEKHSGVSCGYNLAYSAQQWLPFAQMPHHHDWHHEGFKGSNYTFSSIGGLWDCLFGTRKSGRYTANQNYAATKRDLAKVNEKKDLPAWFSPLYPLVGLSVAVMIKLM